MKINLDTKDNSYYLPCMTNYAQQASKPSWYGEDPKKIYESATSGSSPFNEWYEFSSRDQAINFIRFNFSSNSFLDHYQEFDNEGEIDFYHYFDIILLEDEETGDYVTRLEEGAKPADLSDMIYSESKF